MRAGRRRPRTGSATRLTAALAGCLLVPLLAGCGSLSVPDELAGDPDKVQVAAGFYPLAWVAEQVGGRHVEVTNLTQPGAEPHDLELTISETVAIARADVIVHEQGFQPAVDDGVEQDAEGSVVEAGAVAGLRPYADHPDEPDPHFWQDPQRLAAVADAVARRLATADPAHRAVYEAGAARLDARLGRLDRAYRTGLAGCERHTIVATHDAFGYLAKFGLEVEPITGLSPGAEPTPADLARLQDLIRTDGITTVFSEELVSPKTAETLAQDTGVRSEVLDPVEGLSDRTADEDYLSLMRHNLHVLEEANGCR